jgi:hypothetical protein
MLKKEPRTKVQEPLSLIVAYYGMFIDSWLKKNIMIRKLKSGEYRLYSRKKNPKTNKRRNLGTFSSLAAAQKHEREVQYFKKH